MTHAEIAASLQRILDSPEAHKRSILSAVEKLLKSLGEK